MRRGENACNNIQTVGVLSGVGRGFHAVVAPAGLKKRMEALYRDDLNQPIRKSHQNPSIIKLYEEYLGEPGSHLAHQLLHTHYVARKKF